MCLAEGKPQKETAFRVASCTYCAAKGTSHVLRLVTECQSSAAKLDVNDSASSDLKNVQNKRDRRPHHATACTRHLIEFQQNLSLESIY